MATEEKGPGSSEGPGNGEKEPEKPADLTTLQETIVAQNNLLLSLNKRLEAMEKHQDTTDDAIIEVAKKVGSSGGGGGLLAQILPLLSQRGPGPLEKIAMRSFLENMAFSALTTRRIAKKQFGDEYTKMVKEMEAEMSGAPTE